MTCLSIIIPILNERATLAALIDRVFMAPLPEGVLREVICVDDASTDGSPDDLARLAEKYPLVTLRHPVNRGKGASLRSGINACHGEIVLFQDADLEYDPRDYAALIEPVLRGDAEVVYGSRFLGGWSFLGPGVVHYLANRALTALSRVVTGLDASDMECCYKVFRRDVLDALTLREDRFGIEPEITAKVARRVQHGELRFLERAIRYTPRSTREGKKIGLGDGIRAIYCIIRYAMVS